MEEPPKYLKFIFATTEVKKIPITVISRCQRYDLSRIKSEELFNYLKNITIKEKKDIEDNAIKLIVKLSELNTLEDGLLLVERFNKSLADKLFKNLSNTIEKRSFAYVNRYVKTDMEIASIIFDRKRQIRWAGIYGDKYISYFQRD